jgi:hypothetical protein
MKPGSDMLIRATVMDDGRLMVSPGAVIDARAVDVLGEIERGKGLGEAAMLMMYFRCEQDRQRFADGLGYTGGDRGCAGGSQSSLDEPDDGPHLTR